MMTPEYEDTVLLLGKIGAIAFGGIFCAITLLIVYALI